MPDRVYYQKLNESEPAMQVSVVVVSFTVSLVRSDKQGYGCLAALG